jgi:HSP20 family protein
MATTKQAQQGGRSDPQSAQQQGTGQQSTQGESPQQMQRTGGGQRGGMSRRGQFAPSFAASPFTLMRALNDEMGRLFEGFLTGSGTGGLGQSDLGRMPALAQATDFVPQIQVFERNNRLVIRADLPGVERGDVRVEIRDDAVVLQGERREEREDRRGGIYVSEVVAGSFYREIPLPENVNVDQATAIFRDGVLEIVIPETEQAREPRRLDVQDASQSRDQSQAQGSGGSQSQAQASGGSQSQAAGSGS